MTEGLFLLAFSLASGYLLHEISFWRMWFREHPGHVLYFRVLVAGLIWQVCFGALWDNALCWPAVFPHAKQAAGLAVALLLCLAANGVQKNFIAREKFDRRRLICSGMHFEYHILRALQGNLPIMVTLDNGKIYIGWVGSVRRQADAKWLTLVPAFSGYRDESQRIKIVTDYADALDDGAIRQRSEEGDLNLDVTLPVEKIASLQFFDAEFYNKFNPPENGESGQ